jgi:hypothetical protein
MNTSLASFGQMLRKLCLFKPSQSREPLPGHCCSRALSQDNTPPKLAYLLAHTSKWGVLEHSRIITPWILAPVGGRRSQRPGPSPTLGSLGPSHHWRHKSRVSLRSPPCAHGVSGIPYGEVRDKAGEVESKWPPLNTVNHFKWLI